MVTSTKALFVCLIVLFWANLSQCNYSIYTFAGNGCENYIGDGRPATNAELCYPYGVALSSTSEVYIGDTGNNVIRVVYTNGTIMNFAGNGIRGYSGDGGPATKARLNIPYGVAVSSTGEVYIPDTYNNVIRAVYTNGTIITFAGNGVRTYSGNGGPATKARLNIPYGVAVSFTGEVCIVDTGNNAIRVVYTNGIIDTIAGNGNGGYSGDGGPSAYVQLEKPEGIAISSNGDVYIADTLNNRIRKSACSFGYTGFSSQFSICFGTDGSLPNVCSGHGNCTSPNHCTCFNSYSGSDCSSYKCFDFNYNESSVCSGHGECKSPDICNCKSGYYGNECELFNCFNISYNDSKVCSGHGTCQPPGKCVCHQHYGGQKCRANKNLGYLVLLVMLMPIAMLIILLIWLLKKGVKWMNELRIKSKHEKELHARLLEYEMTGKDTKNLDTFMNIDLKIRLEELTFSAKISEGAGGVVYKGIWCQKTLVIKKLKVPDVQSFIREVSLLNHLRHLNILKLFGYSIDSKGYQYIITEFIDNESLDNLLYNNQLRSFKSKIRALFDIAQGMRFLHEKNIMHRDLKPQNVLVNKDKVCKLCDFGLPKVISETVTLGVIGTWQYMAPEIMNESEA